MIDEDSNITAQVEEVEALSAIYGEDWVVESEANRKYIININSEVRLQVRLPDGYPSDAPPYFELDAVQLSGEDRATITDQLNLLYAENIGQPIIYIWTEAIREYLSIIESKEPEESQVTVDTSPVSQLLDASTLLAETVEDCPEIFHDEPITDRKSTFQAHVAMVTTTSQVSLVMRTLLSNKKISAATHNIQAYRIRLGNKSICEDCDDDGETQAGSRVLHLLNIVGAVNVLVVVSRWYGGIQLGPDRFKHINNCARNILEKHNIIQHNTGSSKESVKKGTRHKKN